MQKRKKRKEKIEYYWLAQKVKSQDGGADCHLFLPAVTLGGWSEREGAGVFFDIFIFVDLLGFLLVISPQTKYISRFYNSWGK